MNFKEGNLYHVYNQGNNQQQIFFGHEDYHIFLGKVQKLILPHSEMIAYCLMPNHFHFLIFVDERVNIKINQGSLVLNPLSNGIRKLLSSYARRINKRQNTSGSLFRPKTKSKCISEMYIKNSTDLKNQDYYSNCFIYIHQNPLKANLVKKLEDWEYSSFRDYIGLRKDSICNKKLAIKYCSYDKLKFPIKSQSLIPDELTIRGYHPYQ